MLCHRIPLQVRGTHCPQLARTDCFNEVSGQRELQKLDLFPQGGTNQSSISAPGPLMGMGLCYWLRPLFNCITVQLSPVPDPVSFTPPLMQPLPGNLVTFLHADHHLRVCFPTEPNLHHVFLNLSNYESFFSPLT